MTEFFVLDVPRTVSGKIKNSTLKTDINSKNQEDHKEIHFTLKMNSLTSKIFALTALSVNQKKEASFEKN